MTVKEWPETLEKNLRQKISETGEGYLMWQAGKIHVFSKYCAGIRWLRIEKISSMGNSFILTICCSPFDLIVQIFHLGFFLLPLILFYNSFQGRLIDESFFQFYFNECLYFSLNYIFSLRMNLFFHPVLEETVIWVYR